MEKKKNIMIREYPIQEKTVNIPEKHYYYYFKLSDNFKDEIIKITLIISIISLSIGCIALAIALMK